MRNQKGITLIALVITIIVLLILAGVSIAMLTGENGILTRAGDAQEATTEAEAEEALKLALSEILSNKLDPTYVGTENVINETNISTLVARNNSNVTATATKINESISGEEGSQTRVPAYYTVKLSINAKQVSELYVVEESGKIEENPPAAVPVTEDEP